MVCVEHVTIALLILLPSLDQELFIIVPPWCPCEAKERDMVLLFLGPTGPPGSG